MSALDEMFQNVRKANKALEVHYSPSNNGTAYNIAFNLTRAEVTDPAAAELAALRAEVEQVKASNARLFDDLHNQIHQTVGAEMERDELREQVADVNELLWEFTENPNIELGEVGHNKIEDYFKKYSSNI